MHQNPNEYKYLLTQIALTNTVVPKIYSAF